MQFLTVLSSSAPVFGVHRLTSPIIYLYDYTTFSIDNYFANTSDTYHQLFISDRASTLIMIVSGCSVLMSEFYICDRS